MTLPSQSAGPECPRMTVAAKEGRAIAEGCALEIENSKLKGQLDELVAALEDLTLRCDGEEGVRADGSNIQTIRAHAVFDKLKGAGS